MILHQDRYFEHFYEVSLDLISVVWPDIENIYLPEILNSINVLVNNVKHYNIRNLLIDASQSRILSSYEDADRVVQNLINGLATTHLAKLARIESSNFHRENILALLAADMNNRFHYETRFFKDAATARNWLTAGIS